MERDGNGWVECGQGHRHWGIYGAAGLLLHHVDDAGELRVLLQHRADWSHHGGTWGLPGGARDSHESVEEAALREAHEETAVEVSRVRVRHRFVDDHGGWSYTTVYGDADTALSTTPNEESAELQWVPSSAVAALPLHPGFEATWPVVQLVAVQLLVDAANVVGSVPDGWWKDPAGATERLGRRLRTLVSTTVDTESSRGVVASVHVVTEGKARRAALPPPIETITAGGSGDDAIVDAASAMVSDERRLVVVTSDRELRRRVDEATGGRAEVRGTRWLLERLPAA